MRLPSIAVVAMVEPEIAENTVPATTATTASRPGTWRIRRSTPSITFTARPVWNSTSPIRTNSGMGVSEKLATETTLLRTICVSPASPPRNSTAPTRLMTRKENATGSPRNSNTVDPPSINQAAVAQDMSSARRNRVVARRTFAEAEPPHAKAHFDGEQQERDRQRREHPPLGRHQRLDGHRAGLEAGERGAGPVPGDHQAADEAERVRNPLEDPAKARRHGAQHDVDADVLALPQQPGRGQHGHQVEHRLGNLVRPGDAVNAWNQAHVPQQHVGADHHRHQEDDGAAEQRQRFEQLAEG